MRTAFSAGLGAILLAFGLAPAASARTAPDTFPLGVSGASGAVCEAIRNDDDPAAQMRGARAWDVRCRGWNGALGHLYAYSWRGGAALAPGGVWTRTLATHATCEAAAGAAPLPGARLELCKAFSGQVAYVAMSQVRGGRAAAAEGFASLADVLAAGFKVAAGVAAPPKATDTVAQGAGSADAGGLAQATETAEAAPENLRERGYTRNLAWRFADAELDFGALAQNAAAPASTRAEAYLNWALNTSNLGRFNRADSLFTEAESLIGADRALQGQYLSFRALDQRNRRDFKGSLATAQRARQVLVSLTPAADTRSDRPNLTRDASGDLVIGPRLASALRTRTAFGTNGLDPGARVRVQVAQTYLTEATDDAALGDRAAARSNLEHARVLLTDPGLANVAGWLRAEVAAELARQDGVDGRKIDAVNRLRLALLDVRQHEAGSPAEAFLMMELAQSEAIAGDPAGALRDYQQGVTLFKASRGSLGASAGSADTYFRLLLERRAQDPAHAGDYDDRFLAAAESLSSEATADTIARLSARLNQSNTTAAGLIRALEDTRRQVRLKTAEISQLQAQNNYPAPVRAAREAELKSLSQQAQDLEQKVAAADPRYGQLVSTEVSLKDLQAKLKPGEMFLKVVLLDRGGYAMAVGPDWAQPYALKLSRTEAEEAVTKLRKPFETQGHLPSYNVAASYAFFQAVFGPVQDRALAARHIIYEPDSTILSLPITALAVDQKSVDLVAARRAAIRAKGEGVLTYDGVDWLGATADTSLAVSAASFVQARAQPPSTAEQPFIGFGDSVQPSPNDPKAFASVVTPGGVKANALDDEVCRATRTALLELKPLREASQELQTVGATLGAGPQSMVTGESFNDTQIVARSDLDRYRVVYFATHGLLPQPGGCLPEPSLLTSVDDRAAGSDGLLTASKILGMKLNADLVVLSACDTGGGVAGEQDPTGLGGAGEALGGLTRAFIYAGARTLLVSQWQIDSEATVRLMTTLFQAKAPSLGEAMRQASRTLMASNDQYSHPYYWAPFTIVGDAARPMPTR